MTKVLLRFSDKQVDQPIAFNVFMNLQVPLNILNANVTSKGGEILAEVPSKDVAKVIQAFKENNVEITIPKGININLEKCINCGSCYSLCPVDAISSKKDHSIIFSEEKCISCGLCVDTCPTRAIKLRSDT